MNFTFFMIIVGMLLILIPAKAMHDMEEEGQTMPSQAKPFRPSPTQKGKAALALFEEAVSFENFPDDPFISVCSFLEIQDLGKIVQVSTRLKKLTEAPDIWRYKGTKYYGDYLSEEDLKEDPTQKVISHYLSVIVNTKIDLKEIERL